MSISSISSALAQSTQPVTGTRHHRDNDALAAAAKALGMTQDELVTQLQSGKSLDDVAKAQGVSHDALAAAIKASMPPELAASPKADAVVDSIISHKGMPQRPQGPPPASSSDAGGTTTGVLGASLTASQQATLDSLSSLLGTDSSTLMSELRSGRSLADLVQAQGVDQSSLAAILQNGLLFDATT